MAAEKNPRELAPNVAEEAEDRKTTFSRRAIIQAGWTVPVVMAVAPPNIFAQTPGPHQDGHADAHGDSHSDAHVDTHIDQGLLGLS